MYMYVVENVDKLIFMHIKIYPQFKQLLFCLLYWTQTFGFDKFVYLKHSVNEVHRPGEHSCIYLLITPII